MDRCVHYDDLVGLQKSFCFSVETITIRIPSKGKECHWGHICVCDDGSVNIAQQHRNASTPRLVLRTS